MSVKGRWRLERLGLDVMPWYIVAINQGYLFCLIIKTMYQQQQEQQTAPRAGGIGQDGGEGRKILGGPNSPRSQFQSPLNTRHIDDIEYLPQVALPKSISPLPPSSKALQSRLEYTPEIGEKMLEFFTAAEPTRIVVDVMTWKNGEIREVEREVPNPPPSFSKFARSIGTTTYRLNQWKKQQPEFKEYYEECQQVIKEFIVENGLTGKYSGAFAIFAAKNLTDMKDKSIVEKRNVDMNKFLDQLEKGDIVEGELLESY